MHQLQSPLQSPQLCKEMYVWLPLSEFAMMASHSMIVVHTTELQEEMPTDSTAQPATIQTIIPTTRMPTAAPLFTARQAPTKAPVRTPTAAYACIHYGVYAG